MTYAEARDYLFALPRFGDVGAAAYKPGLERMWALLAAMENPHERFESVHIAGTNGKGSTSSMVAAIGTAAGKRIGLHTSPHLFDFAERLRIDGRPAPHDWIADAVERFHDTIKSVAPSFFEASIALSFLYFAEELVDLAVVEVGLGGRLDATNVLVPQACAVTHVGFDHTEILGDSLVAIAREKGGIAKPCVPLLSGVGDVAASAALRETAEKLGARFEDVRETVSLEIVDSSPAGLVIDLHTPHNDFRALTIGLAGRHQAWNAALAVRLAESVWPNISPDDVRTGLSGVVSLSGLLGRCETISEHPRIVADVAHNPEGWSAALSSVRPGCNGKLFVLLGVMADKDAAALATMLAEREAIALPVGLASPRAMSQSALSGILRTHCVEVVDVVDVQHGIEWFSLHAAEHDVLLITGSHLAVAELGVHRRFAN